MAARNNSRANKSKPATKSKPEQAPAQDDADIQRDLQMGVMLLHAVLMDVRERWRTYDLDERTNTLLMIVMATLGDAGSKIDRSCGCFGDSDWNSW